MNIHHSEFTSKKANFFNFWRYQNKDNFRSMNAIISINADCWDFLHKGVKGPIRIMHALFTENKKNSACWPIVRNLRFAVGFRWYSTYGYLKKLSHVHESKQVSVQQQDTVCFCSTSNTVWKDNSTCDIKGVEPVKSIGSKWLTSVQPTRTNQSQCLTRSAL